jgi:hypothetical protein
VVRQRPRRHRHLPGYDQRMRSLPTVLLILSLPAGAIAYVVATRILSSLDLPNGLSDFLVLIAPLFFAGLVMVPFLIPFFDRKAKADLAEHRRAVASSTAPGDTVSEDDPSDPADPGDPTATP